MVYSCQDCSYRGKLSGKRGECPACGSFSLSRGQENTLEQPRPKRWRLIAVTVLWAILIVLIVWKLVN